MNLKLLRFFPIILLSSLLLTSCGASKKLGSPTHITIEPAVGAHVNYGNSFQLTTTLHYSSGKTKDISDKSALKISVKEFPLIGKSVEIPSCTPQKIKDQVSLSASYTVKDTTLIAKSIIPFNYMGNVEMAFNGAQGNIGISGSDGRTALLFRHGKEGEAGLQGGDGLNGHDLSIHVYKDSNATYHFRIVDVETSEIWYCKNRDAGFGIRFVSLGGKGGDGGNGGDGGDGKDGVEKNGKVKLPGAGGHGGDGGKGGIGGTGGSIFLFVHTSCPEIMKRITVLNIGGPGGDGGVGGRPGRAGKPLEGQEPKGDGVEGYTGEMGALGPSGPAMIVSHEEFEIDF